MFQVYCKKLWCTIVINEIMFFLFRYGTDVITFDVVYHWKGNKILIKKILSKIFRNSSGYIIRSSNIAKNNRKKQKNSNFLGWNSYISKNNGHKYLKIHKNINNRVSNDILKDSVINLKIFWIIFISIRLIVL